MLARAMTHRPAFDATAFAALSLLCLIGAPLARADEPVTVAVVPFDDEGTPARDLSAAVELELEFEEHLLLTPWKPLVEAVGTRQVGDVSTATLGSAMVDKGIRAVLRAERVEENPDVLMLYLHRAPEAEVVLALPLRIKEAIKNPRQVAVVPVSAAIRDLELLTPLSERAITAVLYEFLGDEAPEPEGRTPLGTEPESEPEKGPEAAPDEPMPTPEPAEGEPESGPEAPPAATPFADYVRVAAYYSPTFFYYRACQPGVVDFFGQCEAAATSRDSTELPLLMLGSGAVFAESFAIPFVGIAAAASASFTEVRTNNGSIDPFTTLQIATDIAVIPHYQFNLDDVGIRVGARLGYGLSMGITEDHRNALNVTLLPSHDSHQLIVGARLAAALAGGFEVSVDLDSIPFAFHAERPDVVGTPSVSYGTRGRINADVLVFAGLRVALFVEGTALRVDTEGQGDRLTRALEPFIGGDLILVSARAGVGVGFGL